MLAKSISALAVLAFAAQATATEAPMPYKANRVMKMSVHDIFGIGRRQDNGTGYQPTQSVCGTGNTCAEACGAGYEACKSTDSTVHCFDAAAGQTCCPDSSGNSCDAGYYCTLSTTDQSTVCCPNSMTVAECAVAYSVSGSLVSETTSATSSSSTSSSAAITTTSAANTTTSSMPAPTGLNGTTTDIMTSTGTTCTASISNSAVYPGGNTTSATKVTTASPSGTSVVSVSGAGNIASGPFGALVLVAAALVALL